MLPPTKASIASLPSLTPRALPPSQGEREERTAAPRASGAVERTGGKQKEAREGVRERVSEEKWWGQRVGE